MGSRWICWVNHRFSEDHQQSVLDTTSLKDERNAMTAANRLFDSRVNCWSLMTTMTIGEYLALVEGAYANRGGLKYQREALKSTSGRRIRARMINDIVQGAVLPPLVLGIVVDLDVFGGIEHQSPQEMEESILGAWKHNVSIIDGMQRTTALLDAVKEKPEVAASELRIECWVSNKTDSLIYRMLVLNTGQVPWNLRRQLEVVYAPLIEELRANVQFERLLNPEKAERRTKGGEFSPESLIEAYLAFGLRRTEIDTQESLAEEFSRLDMAEAISTEKYSHYFYPVVQRLVDLDRAFSRLDEPDADGKATAFGSRFETGRNIFDSQPARVGFVVACALAILGRLGGDRTMDESNAALQVINEGAKSLVERLGSFSNEQLRDFLGLDVLSERVLGQKRSAIGRYERTFFETSFKVLVEEKFAVPTLEVCWRA